MFIHWFDIIYSYLHMYLATEDLLFIYCPPDLRYLFTTSTEKDYQVQYTKAILFYPCVDLGKMVPIRDNTILHLVLKTVYLKYNCYIKPVLD